MQALEAIVLGIVQGLTEFLPISSTGHLRVVPAFFGWEDPGAAFTAITQMGTMAAVLLYFRHELWKIAVTWLRSLRDPSVRGTLDARMGWYLIIGTIPISIFGLAFDDSIESGARDLYLIGSALIALGLLLLLAEKVADHRRPFEANRWQDAVVVGFAQAAALVPGVSRSGATLTAGLFLGFDRPSAARFSFLLSVPAVVLSGVYQLAKLIAENGDEDERHLDAPAELAIATFFAFIVGYASIAFLLRWLGHHTTAVFVAYRVALGALVLILTASGAIS